MTVSIFQLSMLICLSSVLFVSSLEKIVQEPIVTPKQLDSRVWGIFWVTPQRVFLLTNNGKLHRSEDTGISWNQEIFLDSQQKEEAVNYRGVFFNSDYVIVFGRNGTVWLSSDQGKTFGKGFRLAENEDGRYVRFHPFKNSWILFGASPSSSRTVSGYHLYATFDGGKTFRSIEQSAVSRFYWNNVEKEDDQSIIYTKTKDKVQNRYELYLTSDLGNTKKQIYDNVYEFVQLNNKLIAVVESGFETGELFLRVCSDSKTWNHASFPYTKDPLFPDKYYIVPWVSEAGQTVSIAVTHGNWANLYGSDSSGLKYTLLEERVSYIWRIVDYVELRSVDGVNFVNIVYDEGGSDQDENDDDLPVLRKSKMSWDNGGEWHPIAAPRYNSLGQPIICSGECSLHLNGWSSVITRPTAGPLYTDPSAIGLALATGGVGEFLPSYDQLNTYFTRDGGASWQEVVQGSTIYEFGDQGGIIIVADNINPTKQIKYTLDQGLKWYEFEFTDEAVEVSNIRTEPENNARTFIIQAVVARDQSKEIIYHLDFSNVFPRTCTDDDLEQWSPTDPFGGKQNCLLGRNTTYVRRKQDVECFNTQTSTTISVLNCPCTDEDYECTFGYDPEVIDGKRYCIGNGEVPLPIDETHCEPGKNYTIPSGYRKVPGDTCEGGVQYPPMIYTCPGKPDQADDGSDGGLSGLVVGFIVFAVLLVIGGGIIFILRTPSIREKFNLEDWRPSFLYTPVRTNEPINGEQEFHFGTDSDDEDSHTSDQMPSSLPISDQNL